MWIDPIREQEAFTQHAMGKNMYKNMAQVLSENKTPALRVPQISQRYPILPVPVVLAAAFTDVPVESEALEQVADEYAANWAVKESQKWNEINDKYKDEKTTDDMTLNLIDILTSGWAPGGRTPEEVGKSSPLVWVLGTFDAIRESWNKWNPLPTSDVLQFGGGGVPYRAQGRIWRYFQDLQRYDELLEKGYSPDVAQSNIASLVNISEVPNLGRDLGAGEYQQNIDFLKEAIKFSGENYIWAAAKKVMRGEAINMDRSKRFFFESVHAEKDPQYQELLTRFGGDEKKAKDLYYLKIGTPIKKLDENGQINYLSIENPNKIQIFSDRRTNYNDMNVTEYAARELMDNDQLTEYSWGRYEAGQFLQQGTTSYKVASGLLDFTSALPAEYITGGLLNLTKIKKLSRSVDAVSAARARRLKSGDVRFLDSKRSLRQLEDEISAAKTLRGPQQKEALGKLSRKEQLYVTRESMAVNNPLDEIFKADRAIRREYGLFNGRMQGIFAQTPDKLVNSAEARTLFKHIAKADEKTLLTDKVLREWVNDDLFWIEVAQIDDELKIADLFKGMLTEGVQARDVGQGIKAGNKLYDIKGLPKGFSNVANKMVRGVTGNQDFAMRSLGSFTGEKLGKAWGISRGTLRLLRHTDSTVKEAKKSWKLSNGAIDGNPDTVDLLKEIYKRELKPRDVGVSRYTGFSSNYKAGTTPWADKILGVLPGSHVSLNNPRVATAQIVNHLIQNKYTNKEMSIALSKWTKVVNGNYGQKTEFLLDLMNNNYKRIKDNVSEQSAEILAQHINKNVREWEKKTKAYFKNFGFDTSTGKISEHMVPFQGMKSTSIKTTIAGEKLEIMLPSSGMLSEMSDNIFPLLNQDMVNRVQSKIFYKGDIKELKIGESTGIMLNDWKNYFKAVKSKGVDSTQFKPDGFIPTNAQMEDAFTRVLDFYTRNIFKPIVLIRPAFFTRIFMEEQARIAAAGMDGVYNHPFRYLQWVMAHSPSKQHQWYTEVINASKKDIGHFDDIMRSSEVQRVLHVNWQVNLLAGDGRTPRYDLDFPSVDLKQGTNEREYAKGIFWSVFKLRNDPVAKYVAGASSVENAAKWFISGKGQKYRQELLDMGEASFHKIATDDDAALQYIKQLENRIRQATGHKLEPGIDYMRYNPKAPKGRLTQTSDIDLAMNSHNTSTPFMGDIELRNFIANGEMTRHGYKAKPGTVGDSPIRMLEELPNGKIKEVSKRRQAEIEDNFVRYLTDGENRRFHDLGRLFYKDEKLLDKSSLSRLQEGMDGATKILFDTLMEKPINYLNRSSTFKQYRWAYISQQFPYMTKELQEHFLRELKTTTDIDMKFKVPGFKADDFDIDMNFNSKTYKHLEKISKGRSGSKFTMDDYQLLSDTSKSYGLTATEKLLYDVTKRHAISHNTRNLFPFPEVWFEMLTTWPKLLAENPTLGRKAHLAIKGGRGTSALGYTGEGFFAEDPNGSGEQMFAYPFGGFMSNLIFGEDSNIKMSPKGYVTGVNLLGQGFVPGPTPFAGWAIDSVLPNNGTGDEMRSILFGDFGPPSGRGFWQKIIPSSPSFTKFMAAQNFIPRGSQTEVEQMRASTSIELFKLLKMEGGEKRLLANGELDKYLEKISWQGGTAADVPYEQLTPDIIDTALRDYATAKARLTYGFRAFAQFIAPTGFSPRFYAEDTNGKLWGTQILAKEYQNLLRESNDDHVVAYEKFIKLYGYEHSWLTTAKSESKGGRKAYAERVLSWQRDNKKALNSLPLSAFYLLPDNPLEERSYQEVIREYNVGERGVLSIEQFNKAVNDTVGYFRYTAAKRQYDRSFLPQAEKDAIFRNIRLSLEEALPGFNRTGGLRQPPKSREILAEMIEKWPNMAIAQETEAGRVFVNEFIPRWLEAQGASSRLSPSRNPDWWLKSSDRVAVFMRADFQAWANETIKDNPDFAAIWTNIITRMFRNDLEYYSVLDG